jgi:hypothetical protein
MLDELDDLRITQVKTLELVLVQNDLFCRHAYLDVDVEAGNVGYQRVQATNLLTRIEKINLSRSGWENSCEIYAKLPVIQASEKRGHDEFKYRNRQVWALTLDEDSKELIPTMGVRAAHRDSIRWA